MTREEREKQFQQQLMRDAERIKKQLLEDEKYSYLKDFYGNHFEEIAKNLRVQNSRLAIEDINNLDSSLFHGDPDEFLFMKQVNDAIKSGIIKAKDFEVTEY